MSIENRGGMLWLVKPGIAVPVDPSHYAQVVSDYWFPRDHPAVIELERMFRLDETL